MKSNLPQGWVLAKLGSITKELNSGFACGVHNSTGDGIAHLRPMNVTSKGAVSLKDLRSVSASSYDKLRKGDVLFNNTNSTELVGKTGYITEDSDWGYSNHMTRLRFDTDLIESKYIAYHLHNLFYEGYFRAHCNNHVSQASISAKFLANEVTIPLPPLPEQHRIVAQLDAAMQKLDANQERLEKVPELLKKFRQAVLTAAVSGKLTEAWRTEQPQGETGADLLARIRAERRAQWEDKQRAKLSGKQLSLNDSWKSKYEEPAAPDTSELPEPPEGWAWASGELVADFVDPQPSHRTPPEIKDGVPYIGMGDVKAGNQIDFDSARKVHSDVFKEHIDRYQLKKGDFFFGKIGTIGNPVLLPEPFTYTLSANVILVQPHSELATGYVHLYMSTPLIKEHFRKYSSATSQAAFGIQKARVIPIALPPLAEQEEVVRQVNHYFELADQLEARFEQAAALVEQLPQALLAKAFSGQLVPQDPTDEPASKLLERLQAEPAAPVKGKRGRKAQVATEAPLFE
jgi:type I restriction enzyme S subunit